MKGREPQAEKSATRPKILVVEDEPAIADTITYALRTDGFDVAWCGTAREAGELAGAGGLALMVLDIGLPDGNGFDVCRDVRRTCALPVIFLTARSGEIDKVVGLEIGGDDYLVKPFSPRELVARVRAVLRRSGAAAVDGKESLRHGPFVVDKARARITCFGRPLELSRYEFRILEVLVRRPGWVFSRDQLMELAWEEPEASMDRTVDTHIKTLRTKLHRVKPGFDPIETRRGTGYSLKERL